MNATRKARLAAPIRPSTWAGLAAQELDGGVANQAKPDSIADPVGERNAHAAEKGGERFFPIVPSDVALNRLQNRA
jgi:hypothetical protein